jgi:hypothetical protein
MKPLLPLVALLALAGCGSVQALKPGTGAALPPKAAAARTQPTPDQLMTPDTQARPQRTDESLRKSEKRQPDPFDLPPTS